MSTPTSRHGDVERLSPIAGMSPSGPCQPALPVTGDASWHASRMRRYVGRVESCHHRPVWRALRRVGLDYSGHGWNGWLRTEKALPHEALADDELLTLLTGTARTFAGSLPRPVASALRWLRTRGDPNARTWTRRSFEGLCYTPLSTSGHRRMGARERLKSANPKRCVPVRSSRPEGASTGPLPPT